jgi:hypothetical protein
LARLEPYLLRKLARFLQAEMVPVLISKLADAGLGEKGDARHEERVLIARLGARSSKEDKKGGQRS